MASGKGTVLEMTNTIQITHLLCAVPSSGCSLTITSRFQKHTFEFAGNQDEDGTRRDRSTQTGGALEFLARGERSSDVVGRVPSGVGRDLLRLGGVLRRLLGHLLVFEAPCTALAKRGHIAIQNLVPPAALREAITRRDYGGIGPHV